MRILGVDTSSNVATAAIMDDDKLVCEFVLNNKLTHSQTLMPIIDECFKKSDLEPSDIDVFAVAQGPGSFTGLRIGVTTVKGLAHGVNKSVIGVSTLEAMAYNLPFCPYIISPIMDARREQVYNALYKFDGQSLVTIKEPRALSIKELTDELLEIGEQVVFLGDGVPVHQDTIKDEMKDLASFAPKNVSLQRASGVCLAAMGKEAMHYARLAPVYLRKSQAERELEERGNK